MKVLALRRADTCADCAVELPAGTKAAWDAAARTVRCLPCTTTADSTPTDSPMTAGPTPAAGGSARREYDKRSQRREAAIRSRHPRLGGLVLALTNEPASTRVWAQGAHGERAVAAKI